MNDRSVLEAPDPSPRAGSDCVAPPAPAAAASGRGLPEFGESQRADFDKSPRPMRIIDPATLRYLAVNDAALVLYGYSRAEFLRLTLKHTRHPEEHADQLASLGRHEGYFMHRGPLRHVRKSGEVFLAEVVSQDVLFEGRRARVSLTIDLTERTKVENEVRRNISDRRTMEAALRESQQQFRAVTETANEAIVSADGQGNIVYLNQSAAKLFGYSAEEAIGEPLTMLMPPRFRAAHAQGFHGMLAGRACSILGKTVEFVGQRKDGAEFPLELSLARWTTSAGTFCAGIMRDISRRKRAENALRESEERFRQLAENIKEVFWINTPPGDELVYVSPAYEEIWGRTCESLYRNPRAWMDQIHPDDLPAVREAQSRMPSGVETDVEYRIVRPDGTLRWIRDRSYPMRRGDGTTFTCGIAEDITSRKRGEEERVTHALHQRDALVREVHHRIKNHLQGIAGLLRNKAGEDAGAARTIEAAVAQLQSVAVVYGLQSELAESGVPLHEMLEAICASAEGLSSARVKRRFPAAGGRLRLAETEAVPVAVALNELVFNAIEHGERRAGSPAVEVALTENPGAAEIRIVNRGKLPARFDYERGIGTGTGLDLVRTLLGPAGSELAYRSRGGKVDVSLKLREPLVAVRKRVSRRRSRP